MSKAPATAPPAPTAQRLLSEEFGAGASNYDEADLIVWKAAGEAAANAAARKDFLQATLELERCVLLRPDSRKSASNLARARTRCGTQFWQRLPATLEAAGFQRLGERSLMAQLGHEDSSGAWHSYSVTVELSDPSELPPDESLSRCVAVSVDGFDDSESLAELVALEMAAHTDLDGLGARLLRAIGDMVYMAGDAADASVGAAASSSADKLAGEDFEARALARLPSADEVSQQLWSDKRRIRADRPLHILTWGDAMLAKTSEKLKAANGFHVNAKMLNGRGGGADTSQNALQDGRILLNVAESLCEGRGLLLLQQTLRKIEETDAACISVFCTKGRHRSVSLAELLHAKYYPHGVVRHLTIT